MISVQSVSKKYGNLFALNDISLDIKKGEIIGLLGPNGAGKTTLMKILTCFMPQTTGSVTIGNEQTTGDTVNIRRKIGYLPENAPLYQEMTIFEYLEYIAAMHEIPKGERNDAIRKVMEDCDLNQKAYQNIGELSKGYKQRVGLAAAMIHNPDILILDEPTAGLDPNQISEIRSLIKNAKGEKTILFSTHILQEVKALCDRIIVINDGRIVASGTEEELQSLMEGSSYVVVQIEGSSTGVPTLLEKIEGVEEITIDRRGTRISEVTIRVAGETDIRREVIEKLTANKYGLINIEKNQASLEEVFSKLTKNLDQEEVKDAINEEHEEDSQDQII